MKTGCLKTLVIDDDAEHTQLLREVSIGEPCLLEIDAMSNGEDALRYLKRAGCRRPDFVILDLHLPGKDGFEVLSEIRADPRLRTMPVMILSSTADLPSVTRAYSSGANVFFAKPVGLERYRQLVKLITTLWTIFAELPE
jgi:two-component system, chemotaxis family, response regulator Rcp1